MVHGTVVRYMERRGFGFVRGDDGPEEYFFHCKNMHRVVSGGSVGGGHGSVILVSARRELPEPKVDERIVFEIVVRTDKPNDEATPWAYEDDYTDAALESLES